MDLVGYLESKNIQLNGSGDQAYTHCFFCNEDTNKHGRLYFNVDPDSDQYGMYYCFLCQSKGGINSLRKHFGDAPIESQWETPLPSRILNEAADYYTERLWENPEAYEYLTQKRGLSDETIKRARLGWADGGLLTHLLASGFTTDDIKASGLVNQFGTDFLYNKITIPYLEMGSVVSVRGKEINGKYLTPPGHNAKLYNVDCIRDERTVLIAAGEFDALVLTQLGYPACGVPGERIWKSEWTELLGEARRIYILFDNDTAGRAGSEKLAATLGPRTRVVEMPEARPGQRKIDVSEWYVNHGKHREDFDYLLAKSKGGLLVSVDDAFERWLEIEGNPNLTGLRFNIKELDSEMNHGLLPGQVVTLIAKTNAGKTIITLNILHRMKMIQPELKVLYCSLEQTRNEWFERAHRIHSFYEPGVTTSDTIDFWKDNLLIIDKNRLSQDELEVCIDQYEYETGQYPDIVVIDYLGYYARSFEGEEYTRVTSAIMGLKAIAKDRQIVIYAPHQVNRQGDFGKEVSADQGRGSGAVEETSDMMVSLWSPDQQVGVDVKEQKKELHMKILKSRDGGVNKKVRFQFAPLTLAIVPLSDPLYERAAIERNYAMAGDDWKQAVNRHKTGNQSVSYKLES